MLSCRLLHQTIEGYKINVCFPGYIGSSSFLLQVKKVIEDLKCSNPDLTYGLYDCHFSRLFSCILRYLFSRPDFTIASHTYACMFNDLSSWTTWVSQYKKGNTNLDFAEAKDSEWQWHQLGHMQVCISLQTDNHTSTPPLSYLQAGCPSCCPANSVKALKVLLIQVTGYAFQHNSMSQCLTQARINRNGNSVWLQNIGNDCGSYWQPILFLFQY